jgi:transcription initiation factor TFIID subunit TAF12
VGSEKPWTATENGVRHEGRGRGRGEVDSSQDQLATRDQQQQQQQQQQQVRSHDKAHLYRRVHQSLSQPSATAEEENPQRSPPE